MSKTKKRLIWIIVLVIIALVAVVIVKKKGTSKQKVTTSVVQKRTIAETVVANGKIQPETEVIISSEVSGKILELPFKEGAKVNKGDLLVKINPDLAQSALDRAQATVNSARANKANADARLLQAEAQFRNSKVVFERNEQLLEQGAISQSEFDNLKANYETAEAEVFAARESVKAAEYSIESARASVNEAKDSYSRTTIYAPMDGTISRLNVEVGEQVVGAMQMTGTEIMRVANLEIMEVLADVNESDIVRVSFGDTAAVEVDAYIDRQFKGVITEIASSAISAGISADQVTNFEVKIRILESSYADLIGISKDSLSPFRPGMNATVDIKTNEATDVLSVPIEAITSRKDTSSAKKRTGVDRLMGESASEDIEPFSCVFILDQGKIHLRPVETGIQDDMFIEVSGLKEDETIISGPYAAVSQILMPGDEVKVVSKEDLYKKD